MAIRLTIQEDRPKLTVGQGSAIPLRASSGYPIYENNYDNLRNKPSINGVDLVGDKTTEDLGIDVGVTSWNGQTGDVVYAPPEAPVQSVNGKTGAVVLNASDVGALSDDTVIPSKVSQLQNDTGFITGITSGDVTSALGYTPYNSANPSGYVNSAQAASAAPVQSVNGQTGAVSLTIPTVPTDVSDFNNDAGYITSADIPVTSVNTKTGAVSLSASDVGAVASGTTLTNVLQTYATASGYTYWRPLVVGASSGQAESFTPASKTDQVYTFSTIKCQPSSGTIKATTFKGDLTGNVTGTASGNLKSGDNVSSLTNDAGYLTLADLPIYNGGVS